MAKRPTIMLERGIPVPSGHHGKWKAVLLKMRVNDSFEVPENMVLSLRGSISNLRKKLKGHDWVVKKHTDSEYRCWRVK